MNKFLLIFFGVVCFVIGVIFASQFKSCVGIEEKCLNIKDTTIVHITRKTFIDTIPFKMEKPKVLTGKNNGFDSTKYNTCNVLVVDSFPVSDSLIKGTLTINTINNQTKDFNLSYKPLFPKYILRIDSVIIDSTKTVTQFEQYKYWMLSIGAELGQKDFGLLGTFKNKKDFTYGYKFSVDYTGKFYHSVNATMPIFRSKHKNKINKNKINK